MNLQQFSSQPHILVVDDDQRIRQLVSRYLWNNGFLTMEAANADEARTMLANFSFDAMVLDIMMPGETGVQLTRSLNVNKSLPILLLTALSEIDDRIDGFDAGADDYLPKPFEPRELVARLQAILRRTKTKKEKLRSFKMGRWIFNPEHDELSDGSDTQKLTSAEITLIRALAKHAGEVVSRDKLAELCDVDAGERTIDVQVTRLRRKIEEDTKNPRYLQTVRGKGYMLRIQEL